MSISNAHASPSPAVEFKGSMFTLSILLLRSTELEAVADELRARLAQAPKFFLHAPVGLDLAPIKSGDDALDFVALNTLLREMKLVPVGVRNGSEEQHAAAIAAGLAQLQNSPVRSVEENKPTSTPEPAAKQAPLSATPQPIAAPPENSARPTRVVTTPVRSGQQIYARGGDLVILAAVNAGAEVIADGNIHVYAPLRGRALAGVQGDEGARIFSLNFGPEMVAIAGNYRIFEEQPAGDVLGKPTQVSLANEKLLITPL